MKTDVTLKGKGAAFCNCSVGCGIPILPASNPLKGIWTCKLRKLIICNILIEYFGFRGKSDKSQLLYKCLFRH